MGAVLEAAGLEVRFATAQGEVRAVEDVSFEIAPGETLGVVGESGSGKSQTFLAAMGLLARNGRASGSVRFRGREILGLPGRELNRIRGSRLAMVFQDPMSSLNPYLKVSRQMSEVLVEHAGLGEAQARRRSLALLERVGIADPHRRFDCYPHELSGGMRQRVMIAMALLCGPDLLVADEPTTALDVTVQAQILALLEELRRELDTAIVLITHDLGVVAGLCDRIVVMYAGRIVEQGAVRDLFYAPAHPYTAGLLASVPRLDRAEADALVPIPGQPPGAAQPPGGCAYAPRCPHAFATCHARRPALRPAGSGRVKACHLDGLP